MSPAELLIKAKSNAMAWDEVAERAGIVIGQEGWYNDAKRLIGCDRPFGPHKKASPRCESGGRDYCSCNTCF